MNTSKTENMKIISLDNISADYLRLNIESDNKPSGSIDFISEKINFNITGTSFFKGMVPIRNIDLEFKDGKLIFIFDSKKRLLFDCSLEGFEKVSAHIKTYGNSSNNRDDFNSPHRQYN